MKFWIDIANAPHVTFFEPIVAALEADGHACLVTTWDRGQTLELAKAAWPASVEVGSAGFRRPLVDKALAIGTRARQLRAAVKPFEPDVALGHNSYSQLVAARMLGLPSITMMDYEYQPANHLAFRLATKVVLPAAIPLPAVRRYGARPSKVVRYQGLKEDIALAGFEPDPGFRSALDLSDDDVVVAIRPAAEGAVYHRHGNPIFEDLCQVVPDLGGTVLLSPRTTSQADRYDAFPGVRVLRTAVSGRDLLWHADVVIGGGGTMTREAAVLGTPAFSAFSGRLPAVDQQLIEEGRLARLTAAADLPPWAITRHRKQPVPIGKDAVDRFLAVILPLVDRLATQRQ